MTDYAQFYIYDQIWQARLRIQYAGLRVPAAIFVVLQMLMAPAAFGDDEIALDVQAWFVAYGDLWWKPDRAAFQSIEKHYALPYYALMETGPVVMDKAALRGFLDRVRRTEGWGGSRIARLIITLMNSTSARIEAEWQDFGGDGSPVGSCFAYEYAVAKFARSWKIVALTQRPCSIADE